MFLSLEKLISGKWVEQLIIPKELLPVDACYTEADPHITSIFKPIASAKLYP